MVDQRVRLRGTLVVMIGLLSLGLEGCVGTIVGAAVDTTIEVAKVPFKVGKAVVDVASDGDKSKDDD